MGKEESLADILKGGRKKRRKNGLFKTSHQGRKRRAKMPVFEKPWSIDNSRDTDNRI
jgi:hypothetical protein